MAENPARYAVIGSGWRADFFLKLAALMPDRFAVTSVITRTAERAAQIEATWGVPAHRDLDALKRDRPDFVITSVPWDVNPGLVEALVDLGLPVLSETPPAPDLDGLRRLWSRVGDRRLVQVAEQYLLLPDHAARLAVVKSGILGTPTSAQVSSTHLYHAVSMIRGMLGAGCGPAEVSARAFTAPLVDPLNRDGWREESSAQPTTTTIATIDFGDSMGLYDFTDGQWWNPLRSRRIVVRGSTGELVDDRVIRLADRRTALESTLRRRQTGRDLNLEGFDLDHIGFDGQVVYRNPFAGARLADEEIAIASILRSTARWSRNEEEPPYPLAEACQDHAIGLAIGESLRTGGPVTTEIEAWATT